MKYEKLFEKGKIGKLTIKNRIVMPPMGTALPLRPAKHLKKSRAITKSARRAVSV